METIEENKPDNHVKKENPKNGSEGAKIEETDEQVPFVENIFNAVGGVFFALALGASCVVIGFSTKVLFRQFSSGLIPNVAGILVALWFVYAALRKTSPMSIFWTVAFALTIVPLLIISGLRF